MRITKAWMRDTKNRMMNEVKRIMGLDDQAAIAEYVKTFPHRFPGGTEMAEEMADGIPQYIVRRDLVYNAVEKLIPASLTD